MPVVGCPKCKKKYKLSEGMLGKTVQCSECKTKFKTAAGAAAKTPDAKKKSAGQRRKKKPAAAAQKRSGASEASLKDVGLSGKMSPQFDLFSQPIPDKRAASPLGNHVLEDPGFGAAHVDDEDEDDEDDGLNVDDDMKQLLANPALKSLAKAKGAKKSSSRTIPKPSGFKEIRILGYVTLGFFGVAILCCSVALIILGLELFQINGSAAAADVDAEPGVASSFSLDALAIYIGWGAMAISFVLSVIYWSMAQANTSAMGADGQRFSPMWMAVSWFIPLLNFIWPMQGIVEIYKASQNPTSKKWRKAKGFLWESPVWTLSVLAAPALYYLSGTYAANANASPFMGSLFNWLGLAMVTVSLVCLSSLIFKVTKAQYANFET